MEINPTVATTLSEYRPEPPVSKAQIKSVVTVLPKDGVEQTVVYTYNKWGDLDHTKLFTKSIIDLQV